MRRLIPDLKGTALQWRLLVARAGSVWLFFASLCLVLALPAAAADDSSIVSVNPVFQNGAAGWQISGAARIDYDAKRDGKAFAKLGPGAGAITQKIEVSAANHLMVSAIVHSVPAGLGGLTVRCLDRNGRELMVLHSPGDIRPGKEPDSLEEYFRPHPLTAAVEIGVSKDAAAGSVTVERLELDAYADDDPALKGTQDAAMLMAPFWQGHRVEKEAVLLTSVAGRAASGTLMFQPSRIVSVTNYDGTVLYQQGPDFDVAGRTLIASAGSRIAQIRAEALSKDDLAWNIVGGKQVLVSYEHNDSWTGPVQRYVGDQLPHTIGKLRARAPLRVVAYGDSITFGLGSSHMQKVAPYQSPWVNLFAQELTRRWQDPDVTLFNAAQSGADSDWATRMAGRMVSSLDPDLVIVAFGQNDFWSHPAAAFAANISAVIRAVQADHPQAEFLLVSTMRFDPSYSSHAAYWDLVSQYDEELKGMTGPGVQLVDMTAISGAVFAAKEPRDCLNDPLHPNDYLSRWYAQSMVAALSNEQAASEAHGKKGVGDDDKAAPEAVDATASQWYYNWTAHPSRGVMKAEFVPMLWGTENIDADLQSARESGAKALLGFNEPDSESEGNVSVDQAIALWPKLMATGLRLGSPATTTGSAWIDQFMQRAREKNLRVDFLCLHWYGDITAPNAVGELQKYLRTYWDRYHLPIWLTEYSGADFSFHLRHTTVKDNAEFAAASAAMLEKTPFVERYAWFGTQWTPDSKDYPTSGFYDHDAHALTPVGLAWRAAGAGTSQ
ncbi:MAG TPA: glycosyl hydrolase [Acidobacteriaceae bacterium]|jgi:lysophospholipase L1-like esterase|nr:glycosyl hydrolase [Acidobacteriaceae bacterium]